MKMHPWVRRTLSSDFTSTLSSDGLVNRAISKKDHRMGFGHNTESDTSSTNISTTSIRDFINKAKADSTIPKDETNVLHLAREIRRRLFSLLMKPEGDVDIFLLLADVGSDSLMGTELSAWWKQMFGFKASVLEMLGKTNLAPLRQHAAHRLFETIFAR